MQRPLRDAEKQGVFPRNPTTPSRRITSKDKTDQQTLISSYARLKATPMPELVIIGLTLNKNIGTPP